MRYILPGVQLESDCPLESFSAFRAEAHSALPLCTLTVKYGSPSPDKVLFSAGQKEIRVSGLEDGWLYSFATGRKYALHVSRDYSQLTAYITDPELQAERLLPLLRIALESASIPEGVLSLHSACVELDGQAVCFTAPSGTGKSTRARSWVSGLGARIISGDRPSLCLGQNGAVACGVPWDGKERLYLNVQAPLKAICSIRRGDTTYIRKFSLRQAQRVLMQQCFLPMWDTDAAAAAMLLIRRLCSAVPIYRVTCGPDEAAAKEVRDVLYHHPNEIMEIEQDMKIKNGFTLRNMCGEHIVMPTGKNISQFDGTIVLNDVAAFVWEKLSDGCSREELLEAILSQFEVGREQAEKDLDTLLDKLIGYDVIEQESV